MEVMKTNLFSCHGYGKLYIGGKWVKATLAFDLVTFQEKRIRPVEFDAEHDAIFHAHNLDGELHIEYVRESGCFYGVPVDVILDNWGQVYPFESLDCIGHYLKEGREQEKGSGAS
jgi:hypothetical protein